MRCAQGYFNGLLTVYDESASKLWSHQLKAAVWSVSWQPKRRETAENSKSEAQLQAGLLVACTFEPKLWLFSADKGDISGSTDLTCDPLSIAFACGGEI